MAALILRKIRRALSPDETAAVDPESLWTFYAESPELVEKHFSAVLHDDLRSLLVCGSGNDEDWGW